MYVFRKIIINDYVYCIKIKYVYKKIIVKCIPYIIVKYTYIEK